MWCLIDEIFWGGGGNQVQLMIQQGINNWIKGQEEIKESSQEKKRDFCFKTGNWEFLLGGNEKLKRLAIPTTPKKVDKKG